MQRFGMVIGIDANRLEEYRQYHAQAWPEVLSELKKAHIKNYSIYYHQGLLFSYYEYDGTDYLADMAHMNSNETVKKWQSIMDAIQIPLESREEGEWWASMEEVFYME